MLRLLAGRNPNSRNRVTVPKWLRGTVVNRSHNQKLIGLRDRRLTLGQHRVVFHQTCSGALMRGCGFLPTLLLKDNSRSRATLWVELQRHNLNSSNRCTVPKWRRTWHGTVASRNPSRSLLLR